MNEHYFAREDFTTKNSKCISVRKGEVGQLLEVQASGWWKMSVEGVVGWTPGDFWELLQAEVMLSVFPKQESLCTITATSLIKVLS